MFAPIKTNCGITVHFSVERIYTLRVYVARATIWENTFCLDSWHSLDKKHVRRLARKGLKYLAQGTKMNTPAKKPLPDAVILLADSARGVYIPQHFSEWCTEGIGWKSVSEDQRECLKAGPNQEANDLYWIAWDAVLNNAYFEQDGFKWVLHQDGDLWAICPERMTEEEKRNFGMNEDDE